MQSHTLASSLDAGSVYQWRITATSTAGLSGDASTAEFVTSGAQTTLELEVTIQGTGTVPASLAPVKFKVRLYDSKAFRSATEPMWAIFGKTPLRSFDGVVGTPDASGRTFTLGLLNVTTGIYDVTIWADHTLVNLRNDTKVPAGFGPINMGTLL